jgi:hypothetical protein
MQRLCSADLPPATSFYDPISQRGYFGRLFMNGEEIGAEGRAFAHDLFGTSYELPRLGKFSWENSIAHPYTGTRTVVVGTDDATPGEVYVYIGQKQSEGSVVDRAGLTKRRSLRRQGRRLSRMSRKPAFPPTRVFHLFRWAMSRMFRARRCKRKARQPASRQFLRPEDGAWDLSSATISTSSQPTLSTGQVACGACVSITRPHRKIGGVIEAVLDGNRRPANAGQHDD